MPFAYIILNRFTQMLTHYKSHVSYWQSTSYALNLQFVTLPSDGGSGLSRLSGLSGVSGSSGSSGSSGASGASRLSGRHPPTIKEAVSKVTDTVSCRNNQNSGIVYISLIEREIAGIYLICRRQHQLHENPWTRKAGKHSPRDSVTLRVKRAYSPCETDG